MRRVAWLGVAAVLAVGLGLAPAAVAGDVRDFMVHNETGDVVMSLFVSPVDSKRWEEDILGQDVLEDGQSVTVRFSGYDGDQCEFDIRATNEDGDEWILPAVDLCEISEVTLTEDDIQAE